MLQLSFEKIFTFGTVAIILLALIFIYSSMSVFLKKDTAVKKKKFSKYSAIGSILGIVLILIGGFLFNSLVTQKFSENYNIQTNFEQNKKLLNFTNGYSETIVINNVKYRLKDTGSKKAVLQSFNNSKKKWTND